MTSVPKINIEYWQMPAPKRQKSRPSVYDNQLHIHDPGETALLTPRRINPIEAPRSGHRRSPLFQTQPARLSVSPAKMQGSGSDNPIVIDDDDDGDVAGGENSHHSTIPTVGRYGPRTLPPLERTRNGEPDSRPATFFTSASTHVQPIFPGFHKSPVFILPQVYPIKFNPVATTDPPDIVHRRFRPDVPAVSQAVSNSLNKNQPTIAFMLGTPAASTEVSQSQPFTLPRSEGSYASASSTRTPLFQRQAVPSPAPLRSPTVAVPPIRPELRRCEVLQKLRSNTEYAEQCPEEVERLLGLFGFSDPFLPEDDSDDLRELAQPKRRRIDRSKIPLISPPALTPAGKKHSMKFVHPRDQVKAILTDRFKEDFDPPLSFSTTSRSRLPHGKFQFVSQNVIRPGVQLNSGAIRHPCTATCGQFGDCTYECSCRTVEPESLDQSDDGEGSSYSQRQLGSVISYQRRRDEIIVLTDQQLYEDSGRVEIFECDEGCPCALDCINRVVQKGRTVPLEIFDTEKYGFGVRSPVKIVRGQFIDVYLGEVITEEELERRETIQADSQSSYIYALDWFKKKDCYYIDSTNFGNAMRFVNHNCKPNTRTIPVMNRRSSKDIYDLAFFAIKDIPPFTEITIDYSPQLCLDSGSGQDPGFSTLMEPSQAEAWDDSDEDVVKCLCGADRCRRTLWANGSPNSRRRNRRDINHLEE